MVKAIHFFSKWLSVGIFLLVNLNAFTQADARLDKTEVKIGERVVLTITLPQKYGQPTAPNFSSWDSIVPPADRYQISQWKLGKTGWECQLEFLPPTDSGQFLLPSVVIPVSGDALISTPALSISVSPMPLESNELFENKPIWLEKLSWRDFLPLILTILGLLLVAVGVWFYLKKRKNSRMQAVPKMQVIEPSPEEIALRKLQQLAQKQLWQSGELKLYYSELTHIFREFLEKKYQIQALESTTDEILNALFKHEDFQIDRLTDLSNILEAADLAKFAKATPPTEMHERAFENIRNFIEVGQFSSRMPQP